MLSEELRVMVQSKLDDLLLRHAVFEQQIEEAKQILAAIPKKKGTTTVVKTKPETQPCPPYHGVMRKRALKVHKFLSKNGPQPLGKIVSFLHKNGEPNAYPTLVYSSMKSNGDLFDHFCQEGTWGAKS